MYGGDYRALSFCCKPGFSLTFGYKCQRDKKLQEIGMEQKEFLAIKENFSKENYWDFDECCFGSLSYCCMRQSGCSKRDLALKKRYPNMSYDESLAEYFRLKKILANKILYKVKNA